MSNYTTTTVKPFAALIFMQYTTTLAYIAPHSQSGDTNKLKSLTGDDSLGSRIWLWPSEDIPCTPIARLFLLN